MAKKKQEEIATHNFSVDVGKLVLKKDRYIGELTQYLTEQIPNCAIDRDGNALNIKVPQDVQKRNIRMRVSKFLYASGLKASYKLVNWLGGKLNGYQIIER
jgi:hypothetical protein